MRKGIFIAFITCLFSFGYSQKANNLIHINFLENEQINSVNIDSQKLFDDTIHHIIKLFNNEFGSNSFSQKVGLQVTFHNYKQPDFRLFSYPHLADSIQERFLSKIKKNTFPVTNFSDYSIMISLHCDSLFTIENFPNFTLPREKKLLEYQSASFAEKVILNKEMALKEVLPIFSAQLIQFEKFPFSKTYGELIKENLTSKLEIDKNVIIKNPSYWLANLELEQKNQLIPATLLYIFVTDGDFKLANYFAKIIYPYSDESSIAFSYIEEMKWRLDLLEDDVNKEIEKADKWSSAGKFEKAIDAYNQILTIYPKCAQALYNKTSCKFN